MEFAYTTIDTDNMVSSKQLSYQVILALQVTGYLNSVSICSISVRFNLSPEHSIE